MRVAGWLGIREKFAERGAIDGLRCPYCLAPNLGRGCYVCAKLPLGLPVRTSIKLLFCVSTK